MTVAPGIYHIPTSFYFLHCKESLAVAGLDSNCRSPVLEANHRIQIQIALKSTIEFGQLEIQIVNNSILEA